MTNVDHKDGCLNGSHEDSVLISWYQSFFLAPSCRWEIQLEVRVRIGQVVSFTPLALTLYLPLSEVHLFHSRS